jgi:replicative DNA helicase Mcm
VTEGDPHTCDRADQWKDFLKQNPKYNRKILPELARLYPHERSLYIDYRDVIRWGTVGLELGDEILSNPGKVLEDIQDAIKNNSLLTKEGKPIDKVNVRFIGLTKKKLIRDLRHEDVNKFVTVDGKMSFISFVLPRITEAVFKCPAGHFTKKIQKNGRFTEPDGCSTDGCAFKKLELIPKRSKYIDSQIGRIQEPPEVQKPGDVPQYILIDMEDDLCGTLGAVDRVTINGILRMVQRVTKGEKSCTFDLYIEVNSIERELQSFSEIDISETDEETILALSKDPDLLTKISQSLLPAISGYPEEKKGLALQVFSGAQGFNEKLRKTLRGSIHAMLAGDPGVAKSTMLRMLAQIIPRSVYISGASGITAAGLTYSFRQDGLDNRWVVEAGAAPQADNACLYVDELAKMDPKDINALTGFLEDQKINYAKAGLVGEMNARCNTTVAMNPREGRFDQYAPLSDQIPKKIPTELLSRFDLIYLMSDKVDAQKDADDAENILAAWMGDNFVMKAEAPIPTSMMQKYIALAKRQPNPIMTEPAMRRLIKEFVVIRGQSVDKEGNQSGTVTITKRYLEALVRLAMASCLMRFGKDISLHDAEIAIKALRYSLDQILLDKATGKYDSDKLSGQTKEKRKISEAINAIIVGQGGKCTKDVILRELHAKYSDITDQKVESTLEQMVDEKILMMPKMDGKLFKVV